MTLDKKKKKKHVGGAGVGVGSMTSKYPAQEEKKDIVRRHARLARVRRRGQRDSSTEATRSRVLARLV